MSRRSSRNSCTKWVLKKKYTTLYYYATCYIVLDAVSCETRRMGKEKSKEIFLKNRFFSPASNQKKNSRWLLGVTIKAPRIGNLKACVNITNYFWTFRDDSYGINSQTPLTALVVINTGKPVLIFEYVEFWHWSAGYFVFSLDFVFLHGFSLYSL